MIWDKISLHRITNRWQQIDKLFKIQVKSQYNFSTNLTGIFITIHLINYNFILFKSSSLSWIMNKAIHFINKNRQFDKNHRNRQRIIQKYTCEHKFFEKIIFLCILDKGRAESRLKIIYWRQNSFEFVLTIQDLNFIDSNSNGNPNTDYYPPSPYIYIN